MTYADIAGRDQISPEIVALGKRVLFSIIIGERGMLNRNYLRAAVETWRNIKAQCPDAHVDVYVSGYENDPRPLWEITEARNYICRWVGRIEVDTLGAARDSGLTPDAVGILAKCGAFVDVDPADVPIKIQH